MNDNIIRFPTRCIEAYPIRHFETKFEVREVIAEGETGATKKVYTPLWPFGDGPVPDDELIVLEDVDAIHFLGNTTTAPASVYFCNIVREEIILYPIANTYPSHRSGM